MKSSFDGRLIGFISSLVSEYENTKPALVAPARTLTLTRNAVIRLEKSSRIKAIEIKSGAVWLTGTPANGDLLMQKGARFEIGSDWPYVIQALEPAEIDFLPPPDS